MLTLEVVVAGLLQKCRSTEVDQTRLARDEVDDYVLIFKVSVKDFPLSAVGHRLHDLTEKEASQLKRFPEFSLTL